MYTLAATTPTRACRDAGCQHVPALLHNLFICTVGCQQKEVVHCRRFQPLVLDVRCHLFLAPLRAGPCCRMDSLASRKEVIKADCSSVRLAFSTSRRFSTSETGVTAAHFHKVGRGSSPCTIAFSSAVTAPVKSEAFRSAALASRACFPVSTTFDQRFLAGQVLNECHFI